jgi:hypothetical protein
VWAGLGAERDAFRLRAADRAHTAFRGGVDDVEATSRRRAQLGRDRDRHRFGSVRAGLQQLGIRRDRAANRPLGGFDQPAVFTMGAEQAAQPSHLATHVEHITDAWRLDQILSRLVPEVVDQHQGAAAQGVAPEELHPHRASLEDALNVAQVLRPERHPP